MHQNEEEQWLEGAKRGEANAFEQLVTVYEKTIYNICLRMLANEQEAYDATQEVFVKIWKQLRHFKGESKLSTWIYRIATNECLDRLRKIKKKQEISIYQNNEDDNQEWIIDKPSENQNTEKIIENKAMQEILKQALEELKEEHRTMIVLRDIREYAYDEIADILNISLGTVKSRIARARLAFKKILQQNKEPYKSFFVKKSSKEGEQ